MQPDTQPNGPQAPAVTPPPQPVSQIPQQPPIPPTPDETADDDSIQPLSPAQIDSIAEQGSAFDPGDDQEFDDEIDLSQPIEWRASEYIHQEKDAKWFVLFGIVIAAFMAVAVLLMQSWTFAVLLVVIAVMVIVLAKRPPRVMDYALSEDGLHIGQTLHKFADFKSFGIIRDGQEFSVMLIPRRRLQPGITVYFPEELGEDIVDALGSRLPMKDLHLDAVDRLVRKLRL